MDPEKIINKIKSEIDKAINDNTANEYCPSCGAKVYKGSNFCRKCGKPLKENKQEDKEEKTKKEESETKEIIEQEAPKETTRKKEKKERETPVKCPNCGASLKSFESICPYCQTELRNIKASNLIESFSKELEEIQSRPLPQYQGKDSLMKKLIGQDYNSEREEFEENARENRAKEIARFINNYPVPNTKEDLTEFMILSRSNYDMADSDNDIIKDAWEAKMKQIIEKAKLSLKDPEDIKKITELYENRKAFNRFMKKIFKHK